MVRHWLFCLPYLAMLLAGSLRADYQAGVQAYQQGDFDLALREWQEVIESPPASVHPRERAETLYAVAMLFWLGQSVQQDTASSAGFLRQAAEMDHAGAQSKLGYLHLIGQGVPASHFEARKWLEMAARQGDADAQYNLAVMYRDGIGDTADPVKALQWFEEAAANGDPVSAEVIAQYRRKGALQSAALSTSAETQAAPAAEAEQLAPLVTEPVSYPEQSADQRVASGAETGAGRSNTGSTPASSSEPDLDPRSGSSLFPEAEHVKDEAWILARDESHYTIQVIALKSLSSMNRLIKSHQQMKPFAIYLQGDRDAPLYVLVQGDYPTVEAARAVQQQFPAELADPQQLWIRKFSMVQGLIRQRQAELPQSSGSNHGTD